MPPFWGALLCSVNVLVVPYPAWQIINCDRFDRLVVDGSATARGAKLLSHWKYQSGPGIASPHDPAHRVGGSKSI
jgi:hypothetical protein